MHRITLALLASTMLFADIGTMTAQEAISNGEGEDRPAPRHDGPRTPTPAGPVRSWQRRWPQKISAAPFLESLSR